MLPRHVIEGDAMKIKLTVFLVATLFFERAAFASYAIYVGKNLTVDGPAWGSFAPVQSQLNRMPIIGHCQNAA